MESTLRGRLKNTDLPFSKGLMPLFEAVVNSIQSIEDQAGASAKPIQEFEVSVEIIRDSQASFDLQEEKKSEGNITGFRITDDGAGFNDGNWRSFNKLDSLHKEDKGCRGIGRLLWLKAFDKVVVDSTYLEAGEKRRRKFSFDEWHEVNAVEDSQPTGSEANTIVELIGFRPKYAQATTKSAEHISLGLLEHCLWYFVRKEGVPRILVIDGDKPVIDLFELYDSYMHASASTDTISIKRSTFEITHVKVRAAKKQAHTLGLCAAGRLVKEESLRGRVPGLFATISDDNGEFVYMAYLTSPYLDQKVTNERTGFNIDEQVEGLHAEELISFEDIRAAVIPGVQAFLADSLNANIRAGREKLEQFVSEIAPKYRPLLNHMNSATLNIDPNIADNHFDRQRLLSLPAI